MDPTIHISPNQCRLLVLLFDMPHTFEVMERADLEGVRALIRKGYVQSRAAVSMNPYALTVIGVDAARIAKIMYAAANDKKL